MTFDRIRLLIPILVSVMLSSASPPANADDPVVLISAFAAGEQGAIHAFQLEPKSGTMKPINRTSGVEHPFFLAVSRDRKFLYSIHAKNFGGEDHEEVAAYQIVGRSGDLKIGRAHV